MSDLVLEEAEKDFREILERQLQEAWSKYLTDDQQDEVLDNVAEVVGVYLASMELRWCIENPDLLSMRFRGLVESILQQSLNRVDAFIIADNIGDFSADVFNQLKRIVGEGFDSGSDDETTTEPFNIQNGDNENHPSDSEIDEEASHGTSVMAVRLYSPGTDSMYFESEEEMEFDTNGQNVQIAAELGGPAIIEDDEMADMTVAQEGWGIGPLFSSSAAYAQEDEYMVGDAHFDDVDFAHGNQIDESAATFQAIEFGEDQQELQEGMDEEPVQGTASKKGKGPQQNPEFDIDHFNNDLYDVVMHENDSSWPPEFYKCKVEDCGFQGAWRARQVHFEIKHAKEWKEATGRVAKQIKCPICGYETARSTYMARHMKNHHPEHQAAKSKNSKKYQK